MRKLKLQMQVTVDGFVAGPNGELDWMNFDWDTDLQDYVTAIHKPVDLILMGRKMTDGFVNYWAKVVEDPKNPEYSFARIMHDTTKVVFTKTLNKTEWVNTKLAKGDIVEEVNNLKRQDGREMIVYGGANFVSSLIKHNLIDEYNLFINPTAIGKGLTVFNGESKRLSFKLMKSIAFTSGIVLLTYEPVKESVSSGK